MGTEKAKRTLRLGARTATCTNLNFQPEKAGDDLVERVDMSLKFLVEDMDIDELINAKSNPIKLLWHTDGSVNMREVTTFQLNLKVSGHAFLGISDETLIEFDSATLKRITVSPLYGRKLAVACQVRIDPTDNLEALAEMRINTECIFSFDGSSVPTGKANEDQGELNV